MSGPDLACDAIDLVSAAEYTPRRIVKRAIFVVDLVDGRAPTSGVVFPEYVAKAAGHQGRYAVGHDVSRIIRDYNYNCVSFSFALRLVCSILNIKVGSYARKHRNNISTMSCSKFFDYLPIVQQVVKSFQISQTN